MRFFQRPPSNPGHRLIFLNVILVAFLAAAACPAQTTVAIALAPNASPVEHVAANELATHLHALYPSAAFSIGAPAGNAQIIYLGTAQDLPARYADQVKGELAGPESYAVRTAGSGEAVIAGSSPRATLFAVDALLEKLGFGFYISYSTAPAPRTAPFSFSGWDLHDTPIAKERVIFDWHNFLTSCSTWNLPDWESWITQASRMRFNAVMVHAYGNNPMYSFSFNGQ
ncbi:MAG TPA: hypothetical protein VNJ12_14095, partial [Candidatus Dormibacteraeota bacterium]|nr:hypothetical protein [Candidatus Dormibacteraeota bacterium]